jgi:hypothetical protein
VADRSNPEPSSELTPDELEQRQRADGTWEPSTTIGAGDDVPRTPDEFEQRQRLDGTFDTRDEHTDEVLTPDMIEQRQLVEHDDDEDRPGD